MDVTELIAEYEKQDKLHVLEVATLFGATQAFFIRGCKEYLSVNTFPSEFFSKEEVDAFISYYGRQKNAMIFESLEYPYLSVEIAQIKRKYADISNNLIAIDDFGTGINNFDVIDAANPNIVKIDRTLLTGIDKDTYRQEQMREMIDTFHARKISVVAEGIETEGEFETMKELGADFFQGYYLKRPS